MKKYKHLQHFLVWTLALFVVVSCQKDEEAPEILIQISPAEIIVNTNASHQFSALMTGTENPEVIWKIKEGATGGSINSNGVYTAPATAGSYTIEAISVADNTKSGTAIVTVSQETVVAIAVTPTSANAPTHGTVQLTATVTNTANKNVTWAVTEGAAGGTVSATGQYTAPATPGVYHVVATSQADPTKTITATITVTAPTAVANAARDAAKKAYNDLYVASALTNMGWTGSTAGCVAGTTPQATKDKVLMRIKYFRTMAGLNNTVTMNATKSAKSQDMALMSKANGTLDHYPPTTWLCYTADGKEAAGKANLAMGNAGPNAVVAYIKDDGSNNYFVGHRRWLLFPKLKEVGTGDTDNTNVLWVVGDAGTTPADMPAFVAWPPQGYVPAPVVYPRWSFSIPGADFTNTTVTMKNAAGTAVTIVMEELNNGGFGDRTIVWKPQGITLNSADDQTYKVTLTGVKVGAVLKDYSYDVIVFKP